MAPEFDLEQKKTDLSSQDTQVSKHLVHQLVSPKTREKFYTISIFYFRLLFHLNFFPLLFKFFFRVAIDSFQLKN